MKRVGRLFVISASMLTALSMTTSCRTIGFKVGLLCLHGQTSTYDNNFIHGFTEACDELGVRLDERDIRSNVAEDANVIATAATEWADDGYSMIFADSFGHQYGMIGVAAKYPDTYFCHGTGTLGPVAGVNNFFNAFADIYEGRYLAGVAAGAKLADDVANGKYSKNQAIIGYVGAWPYAEVISGYTSFFLGARRGAERYNALYSPALPLTRDDVKMKVTYTNSWYDYKAEKEAATSLIRNEGCKLISQHADSMGAPQACALYKIPNVTYNIDTYNKTPDTYLYGCKINWKPYFKHIITAAKQKYYGKDPITEIIEPDYCEGLNFSHTDWDDPAAGSVAMLKKGRMMEGNNNKINEVVENVTSELEDYVEDDGNNPAGFIFNVEDFSVSDKYNYTAFHGDPTLGIQPYLIATATTNGTLEEYKPDIYDVDPAYAHDDVNVVLTNAETDTYFAESAWKNSDFKEQTGKDARSAPYFDIIIDGIEIL